MAKPKILIIDPDEKNLRLLAISLKKSDFNVTVSTDGRDSLEKIESLKPDLIISEIELNSLDGFSLLKTLRGNPNFKETPFLFLTKNKSIDDKVKGLKLGANDYLTKPIYLKEILTRVKILLERMERDRMEMGSDKSFAGDLSKMGVVELIQALELGNKTASMRLTYKGHQGNIYFKNGKIVHAESGKIKGEKAFYLILNWSEGTFQIDFADHNIQETITISNQGLLMEALRRVDEWKQLQEIIPPLDTVLVIDSQAILSEHPEQFPSRVENLLAEFDGKKSIIDVVEKLESDEIESLKMISQLYFQGFLVEASRPSESKRVTYYYPHRYAQHVEEKSDKPHVDAKDWASEAEEFLKPPLAEVGEETTFLMPPVEQPPEEKIELDIRPPEKIPMPEPTQKKEAADKVIYLKTYPIQKQKAEEISKQASTPPPPQLKRPAITVPEQRVLAMGTAGKSLVSFKKFVIAGIVLSVLSIPAVIYLTPPLRARVAAVSSSLISALKSSSISQEAMGHLEVAQKMMLQNNVEAFKTAESELKKALELQPEAPEIIKMAAINYSLWGNLSNRRDLIDKGLSIIEEGLEKLPENPLLLYSKAYIFFNLGKIQEAREITDSILKSGTETSELYHLSARIYMSTKNGEDTAINYLYRTINLNPSYIDAHIDLANLLLKKRRFTESEEVLKKALRVDQDNRNALLLLAESQAQNNRINDAIDSYTKALGIDGSDINTKIKLAQLFLSASRYYDAINTLSDILNSRDIPDPQMIESHYLAGRANEKINQPEKALEHYSRVLSRNPAYMDVRERYEKLKPPEKKVASPAQPKPVRKAPVENPYDIALKRGKEYYKKGDMTNALSEFNRAVQLSPNSDEALVELGAVLFDTGNDIEAILKVTRAVTINPDNSRGLLLLGNIYYTRGENDKAINYYKRFLKIAPESPYAGEVKTILGRIQ